MNTDGNSLRAVIYCRVSTDEQAEKGYSLESQLKILRSYAERHGFTVVGHFADDFTGTVPIERRPEGKKAFEMLKVHADVLLVYTMDRLVRPPEDGDEWDMPVLVRGLARLGKEIHTVSRGRIGTDFASLLIAMLDAKGSGEERRKIIERTSRGRNAKAESNRVVGGGFVPYGYTYGGDCLTVVEDEAKIVKMIYRLYVEDHLSLYAIAVKLTELGVETPSEKRHMRGRRSRLPHTWNASAIHRIISSETYKGKLRYGRRIGHEGNGGKRHDGDTFVIDVPALVSPDAWKMAQSILEYNSAIAKRHRKNFYLLSGMVRCGCGRAMHAQASDQRYYYRCSEHSAGHSGITHRQCHEPMFDGNRLEEIVWNYIYGLLSGDFESDLMAAQEAERQRHAPILSEMEVVREMIGEVEREAESIARAVSDASGIIATKLKQEMELINTRHAELSAKLAGMQVDLDKAPLSRAQVEQLNDFRNRVLRGLHNATPEDRRKFYEILQVKTTIKDGKQQFSIWLSKRRGSC